MAVGALEVLLELGFEPEMIEAFGLPGFSSSQREGGLGDEEEGWRAGLCWAVCAVRVGLVVSQVV